MRLRRPTCREATFLVTQRQHQAIGVVDNLRLHWHLRACGLCQDFAVHMHVVSHAARTPNPNATLSNEAQQRLQDVLPQEMNE